MSGTRTVKLGDVAESMKNGIYKAKDAYVDDGVPCLRMYNIEAGAIVWKDIKRMTLTAQELGDYGLEPGDLLVNRVNSRELVGKTALVTPSIGRCVFESKNIRVRLRRDLADPAYVNYALSAFGRAHFDRNAQQVVGMASVSQPQVAAFEFTWQPVEQQREVVAYLDEQLSRLDASVAALRRAQANLKRYRASVLKAACEGRLVPTEAELARAEGRTFETGAQVLQRILAKCRVRWAGKGKYKEPALPEAAGLPELPSGWSWASLDQLSWDSAYGTSAKCSYDATGLPVLRIPNVQAGQIDTTDLKFSTEHIALNEAGSLQPGDMLVIRTNGSKSLIGRSAVVAKEFAQPTTFASYLIRFRLMAPSPIWSWVATFWQSSIARGWIEARAATSAGQHNVSMSVLARAPVPLPPLPEQHRIVAEADRRLSLIRGAEAQVSANLARAKRLRQSILQAAFAQPGSA